MNYFQLVLKQMRQRALSTWLTMLSVALGAGLAISIIVLGKATDNLFGQKSYGYDVIVGAKGSSLQLVLNTIYHMDVSPGNIPYSVYGELCKGGAFYPYTRVAVPTCVGDTYQGLRIVGTSPKMFGYSDSGEKLSQDETLQYRPDEYYTAEQGHIFAFNKFEAVIGSDVTRLTGLQLGQTFQATHGMPASGQAPDIHAQKWKVVGVLSPTHTAADRVVFIPLLSFYTIAEHGVGLIVQQKIRAGQNPQSALTDLPEDDLNQKPDASGIQHFNNYNFNVNDQTIHITLSPESWAVSAILVQSRGGNTQMAMTYYINNGQEAMAVSPAQTMRDFFDTFLSPMKKMLLVICSLVTIVAAVGILVSIYNSVSARLREIAILRALGATRGTILALICLEAGLVALLGSVVGLGGGYLVSAAVSLYMRHAYGEGLDLAFDPWLLAYMGGVLIVAVLAGLAPALKAYRTPVATNLVGG